MKTTVRVFAIVALLAAVVVGCGKVEKILPKKDGLWTTTSVHALTYLNDTLISDTTLTDSLGETYFAKDGTGYTADNGGANQSPITWSVNDDNNVLTITDSSGTVINADILEVEKNKMTLFTSISSGSAPFAFRSDATSIVERK